MERKKKDNFERDEYAKILDVFLEYKNFSEKELAQGVGFTNYTLLELVPRDGANIKPGSTVYIGPGKRDEILFIKRQIRYEQLTEDAKSELIFALIDIVKSKEPLFIEFFNKAGPITLRKHAIEIIPGIGKKHLMEFLEERNKGEFKNFEDIKKRLSFLQSPEKAIAERILREIKGETELKILSKWK